MPSGWSRDDAAGLGDPDLALDRGQQLARRGVLQPVDVGVVVQAPELRLGQPELDRATRNWSK